MLSNTLRDATASIGNCKDFIKEVIDGDDKYRVTQEGLNKIAFYSVFSSVKPTVSSSPSPSILSSSSSSSSSSLPATHNNGSRNINSHNSTHTTHSTHSTHSTAAPTATAILPANFYTGDDIQYSNTSRPIVGEKRKISAVKVSLYPTAAKKNGNSRGNQQRVDDDGDDNNDKIEVGMERGGKEEGGGRGGNKRGNKMEIVEDEIKEKEKDKSEVSRESRSLNDNLLSDVIVPPRNNGANKPVEQRDLKTGRFIRCYISLTAAAAASGICRKKIANCCTGFENTTPFSWVYRKDSDKSRSEAGIL